ncbi:hypothetical protein CGRA01v4_03194 [Colletotrichum graminicola]|nr:hypothetical protein CGRA01v4_03194 [Colletotrichum graminicola]
MYEILRSGAILASLRTMYIVGLSSSKRASEQRGEGWVSTLQLQ